MKTKYKIIQGFPFSQETKIFHVYEKTEDNQWYFIGYFKAKNKEEAIEKFKKDDFWEEEFFQDYGVS